jgi:glyceraldehyde 3-phosphate dehydrogenase
VSVAEVNEAFKRASMSGPLSAVLDYTEDPIVSSDVLGNPASCVFDAGLTMVQPIGDDQTMVKANGWYDNEWGYANRLVDLVLLVAAPQ